MTAQPEPTVRATRYEVSLLPADDINYHLYAINIEDRGADRWAVIRYGSCLAADGTWSYELRPSSREDDWLATHRFTLAEALRLAKAAAPRVIVNGITAVEAYRRTHPSARTDAGPRSGGGQ